MKLQFVTSNQIKFDSAAALLEPFDIKLERLEHDFIEIQASGEQIARHKAQAAFDFYQKPLIVSDDTWEITALGGFPGAYMHPINDWFTADDWLRLMQGVQDRRIVLRQHVVYQDERGQFYAVSDLEGVLLTQARGDSKYTNLTLISFTDGRTSRAEDIAAGGTMVGRESDTAWHKLGEQLTKSEPNRP
jgi:inosine/xanthosine triphosphate pyrophosphatase family protein